MAKEMQRTEKLTLVNFIIDGVQEEATLSGHVEKEKAFIELVQLYKKPLEIVEIEYETYRYTMPVEQFKQGAKVEKI